MRTLKNLTDQELISYAKEHVQHQRRGEIELLNILIEIKTRDLHLRAAHFTLAHFAAEKLGLTKNQAAKRSQAAAVLEKYPEVLPYLEQGDLTITHLSIMARRLTVANARIIFKEAAGRPNSYLRGLLEVIREDGSRSEKPVLETIMIQVTPEEKELIDQVCRLKTPGKAKQPELRDVVVDVFRDCFKRNDPHEKAKRAAARIEKKLARKVEADRKKIGEFASMQKSALTEKAATGFASMQKTAANEQASNMTAVIHISPPKQKPARTRIPAAVRHAVVLRDGGQCTYVSPDGTRCRARSFLEIDHLIPVARGGGNDQDELREMCKAHNLFLAREMGLGLGGHRGEMTTGA